MAQYERLLRDLLIQMSKTMGGEAAMRILFADDHALVREGILPFLNELGTTVEVFEAESFPHAQSLAKEAGVLDLILLDLKMPGMDGFSGISTFKASHPDVPIVILSGYYKRKDVMAAFEHGISGYISKNVGGMAMVNALRLVLAGGKHLPFEAFSQDSANDDASIFDTHPNTAAPRVSAATFKTLTQRETEILGLLVDGLTNKEIALKSDIQEITVKIHVRNIYRKIGSRNRAQAVKIAMQSGWHSDKA